MKLSIAALSFLILMAASAAGQQTERAPVGYLEVAQREADGRIRFRGWALDMDGRGSPITVIVVYRGGVVISAATQGYREDIAKAYPGVDAKNVYFDVLTGAPVDCARGQSAVSLAISPRGAYSVIGQTLVKGCE